MVAGSPGGGQCVPGQDYNMVTITIKASAPNATSAFADLPVNVKCVVYPVKASPIPPATAAAGQMLFLDVSSRFDYSGPSPKYTISGLPAGSGLSINPSGAIAGKTTCHQTVCAHINTHKHSLGIPNSADCSQSQPMTLKVYQWCFGVAQG